MGEPKYIMATLKIPIAVYPDNHRETLTDYAAIDFTYVADLPQKQDNVMHKLTQQFMQFVTVSPNTNKVPEDTETLGEQDLRVEQEDEQEQKREQETPKSVIAMLENKPTAEDIEVVINSRTTPPPTNVQSNTTTFKSHRHIRRNLHRFTEKRRTKL